MPKSGGQSMYSLPSWVAFQQMEIMLSRKPGYKSIAISQIDVNGKVKCYSDVVDKAAFYITFVAEQWNKREPCFDDYFSTNIQYI